MSRSPLDLLIDHKYHPSLKEEKYPAELFVEASNITVEYLRKLLTETNYSGLVYTFKGGKTFLLLRFGDIYLIHQFDNFLPKNFDLSQLSEGKGLDTTGVAETAYVAFSSYIQSQEILNKL